MYRLPLLLFSLLVGSPALPQAQVVIPLYAGEASEVRTQHYKCSDGGDFVVQFINTPRNVLALVTIDHEFRVFVAALSASGSRYVAGALELWVKGDGATMTNVMEEGSSQECFVEK